MKHISESIIGRRETTPSGKISRRKAIGYAKDYMAEYPDHEDDDIYDQYEAAGEALYYLGECIDKNIADIANAAMDEEEDDVYDRLGIFLDAIREISRLK